MIEIGRHSGIPKDQRYCPFCQNVVETEIHFLLECSTYKHLRMKLIEHINPSNPQFDFYTKEQQFSHLLVNLDEKDIAQFIYTCFDLRTFLFALPKRED